MLTINNKCLEIVIEIGHRLKNIDHVIEISSKKENFIPWINASPWDATTLSHGYPGLICLFSELDNCFPGQQWDVVCHTCILNLVDHLEKKGFHNTSLFSGLTGIAFAIFLASKKGTRYQKLTSKLQPLLLEQISNNYIKPIANTRKEHRFLNPQQYDVIVGISGIIPYLLSCEGHETRACIEQLLLILVELTEFQDLHGNQVPGWFVPAEFIYREEFREQTPLGLFDQGLAHGIAGCLAALAKSFSQGIIVPGHLESMKKIIGWLKGVRQDINGISNIWPGKIKFNPDKANGLELSDSHYRDGWCYGSSAIALAILQAARAMNCEKNKNDAILALEEGCLRFKTQSNLECVSFCHGWAGLLAIMQQAYFLTQKTVFSETASEIAKHITSQWDASLPFGYKCLSAVPNKDKEILIDNPGLLDGVTGAALSLLLSLSKESKPWVQIFLIG